MEVYALVSLLHHPVPEHHFYRECGFLQAQAAWIIFRDILYGIYLTRLSS
jgi:hypothetical protein